MAEAPIFRLKTDVWTLISDFLAENDLTRLLLTGNTAFTSTLHTMTTMRLQWKSSAYLDLTRMLKVHSGLKYDKIAIKSLFKEQLVWQSRQAAEMLPGTLRSLSLDFFGSIAFILAIPSLSQLYPSLKFKRLVDSSSLRLKEVKGLSFKYLPTQLQELRLSGNIIIHLTQDDLLNLPTGLIALCLNVIVRDASSKTTQGLHLTSLPDSIETLSLRGLSTIAWTIERLPQMLRFFRLEGFCRSHHNHDGTGHKLPLSLLSGLAHLTSLDIPNTELFAPDDLALFPSTLTSLNCWFDILPEGSIPSHLLPAMRKLGAVRNPLSAVTSPETDLCNLTSLTYSLGELASKFPPSLTELHANSFYIGTLPPSLKSLSFSTYRRAPNVLPAGYPWLLPPTLQELSVSIPALYAFTRPLLRSLPPTLRSLRMNLAWQNILYLTSRSQAGLLPHFEALTNAASMTPYALANLPPTLTSLKGSINKSARQRKNLQPELVHLRHSRIRHLELQFYSGGAAFLHILRNLPLSCTSLSLWLAPDSNFHSSFSWPPNLQALRLSGYPSYNPTPQAIEADPIFNNLLSVLPPHLSELTLKDNNYQRYFDSRKPPSGADLVIRNGQQMGAFASDSYTKLV